MKNIKILDDCDIMERIDEKPDRIKNVGMFIERDGVMLDENLNPYAVDPRVAVINIEARKNKNENTL